MGIGGDPLLVVAFPGPELTGEATAEDIGGFALGPADVGAIV